METMGQRYFNSIQAAQVLGVSTRTITRYIMSGKLKGAKMGKAWVISEDDINAMYEREKEATARMLEEKRKAPKGPPLAARKKHKK